jgi:uncharacterized protein (DUF488 family)
MAHRVYTIGHSSHSLQKIISMLHLHEITAVADVRSSPYSKHCPQFNRENLLAGLKKAGITYVFLGRELGARTDDLSCYVNGRVQYDRLARTALFQKGLSRVSRGSKRYSIALLCAEKDPMDCHRSILICRHLTTHGIEAQHILADGALESHEQLISRLLDMLNLGSVGLFGDRDSLISEAYERRGQQIAYTRFAGDQDAR